MINFAEQLCICINADAVAWNLSCNKLMIGKNSMLFMFSLNVEEATNPIFIGINLHSFDVKIWLYRRPFSQVPTCDASHEQTYNTKKYCTLLQFAQGLN